jgi:hypothetical protein
MFQKYWAHCLAIVVIILTLGISHKVIVHNAVVKAKADTEIVYQKSVTKAVEQAIATERTIKEQSFKTIEKKDEQIKAIQSRLSNTLSELQYRKKRESSTASASTPANTSACTGAELYREDGEFLAREAARAEGVLKQRDYYYQEYENARKSLKQ